MDLTLTFFLFSIPAVVFAGISKGGFGSGAAFASAPMLAMIMPPELAIGLMLPLLMVIDFASLKFYWRKWSWSDACYLIYGAGPGALGGIMLFFFIDTVVLGILIGVISIYFVIFQFLVRNNFLYGRQVGPSKIKAFFLGFLSGFTSFISHAGGPPAAVYLLGRGLTKVEYQATTVILFWWINIFKLPSYVFLGLLNQKMLVVGFTLIPFALLGTWMGAKANRLISEKMFFLVTYILLIIAGVKLIYDGTAGLNGIT